MSRPIYPTVEQVMQLPFCHCVTIGEQHLDVMGHMNIRHYLAIFDDGAWPFFATFGMDMDYYNKGEGGGFALQQMISYLAEVREGETVQVRSRMLARSSKRIHFMLFMVNETTGKLAATMESLGTHADMRIRRTSPYPPEISGLIDGLVAESDGLDWEAPICGAIRP